MLLHSLKKITAEKRAKRVGRGGKRGTTSGRGQKGQKSRSGRRIRPATRDLIQRIAKHRGFRNKPLSDKPFVISLKNLEAKAKPLAKGNSLDVSQATLFAASLIPKGYRGRIKVLGKDKISLALTITGGIEISSGAKEQIEKAGGKVLL